jgi:N-acetylglucosamine kinase-like BadF-type ATPase
MILIADSGSTKTDWRLLTPDGTRHAFWSEGINPYFHTAETVAQTLRNIDFGTFEPKQIQEVYFYSAGSSTQQNKLLMEQGFKAVFQQARVEIIHDLLGAARALFFNESGIACILGTGSNSCLYIHGHIEKVLGGHGYILGDEGSGMHIGRKVIRDFMSDLMPPDVLEIFNREHGLTKDQVSFAVYKQHFPNRFLASFSKFVHKHIDHPYFAALVDDAFMKFFERYIIQYPNYRQYPVRVLGSVGYFFSEQLKKRAAMYDIEIDLILKAPIDRLVAYHTGA